MTTKDFDLNVPPSKEGVDTWLAGLSEHDKAQVRAQQLLNAAVARKPDPAAPDLSRMSDDDFRRYKRSLGLPE